ncbi:MAG: hypothetical protein GX455_11640 [Phycisphaerae bacterium]|nr:hypothetical protein [Phycisphaerae bacterium]
MKSFHLNLIVSCWLTVSFSASAALFMCGDPTHLPPAGDVNSDCHVNWYDLEIFAQQWLASDCIQPTNCFGADLDRSGGVTLHNDFSILSGNWFRCTAPECFRTTQSYTVFAFNDLGMHCTQPSFADMMILPLYNDFHAVVVRRRIGDDPQIVTSSVAIQYNIPSNTYSVGAIKKTDFWDYTQALFGAAVPVNVGLMGKKLADTMGPGDNNDWVAHGLPITPIRDDGQFDAYPLATVIVTVAGNEVARTQAVVPVSTEMNCQLCHNTPGLSVTMDILHKHDSLHPGYDLVNKRPVACGTCHRQEPLASLNVYPGDPAVSSLSRAMHNSHKSRFTDPAVLQALGGDACYACHPGVVTKCLRDVHSKAGMTCTSCHVSMEAVASLNRRPWIDEPSCGGCHPLAKNPNHANYQFEESGKLFRQSKGHMGVPCEVCHNTPHALTPATMNVENVQTINLMGHSGVINKCLLCHTETPTEIFPHHRDDD